MDKEIYLQMSLHEDQHWWFAGRRKIIQSVLDRFLEKKSTNKILEIGCGSGGNLALLSTYGQLAAVELDDDAILAADKRKVCPVHKGYLPDHLFVQGQFDLICMLDVLEHIEDDAQSLTTLASRLTNNGMLLITVPAFMFLWSDHDEAHHHKRRYTRKQLEKLVLNTGLSLSYATYFNAFLFPVIYFIRLVNKIVHGNWASGVKLPPPFINSLLQRVFQLEIPLLNRLALPFGVSILVIAKKTVAA